MTARAWWCYLRAVRAKVGHDFLLATAATGLVFDDAGRVLLARHANAGLWLAPGGAIDPDESPVDAVVREVFEETGLHVEPVNLLGVFRCAKAAAPALTAARGAVVNTASIAGVGRAGSSLAYSATKAGVVSLTQNLARGLAPDVRVNAVAPGAVDSTWMVEWTDDQRRSSIENALLKRRCTTDDIAEVIVFLGFGAAMVTGQTIVVDGGLTL